MYNYFLRKRAIKLPGTCRSDLSDYRGIRLDSTRLSNRVTCLTVAPVAGHVNGQQWLHGIDGVIKFCN